MPWCEELCPSGYSTAGTESAQRNHGNGDVALCTPACEPRERAMMFRPNGNLILLGAICVLSCGAKVERIEGVENAVVAASLPASVAEVQAILRSSLTKEGVAKDFIFSPADKLYLWKDNLSVEDPSGDNRNNPEMEQYLALLRGGHLT